MPAKPAKSKATAAPAKAAPEAPPQEAPPVLLGYQQKWMADHAQVRIYEKSRRIGISWSTAAEASLEAASEKGMDQWYVGYNKEMAEEFILDAAEWAKFYGLAATAVQEEVIKDENKDILTYTIRFASGFRVTALSSRPSNLRGKQGHVIIDEAAFHEQLRELLKAALALLMWGGRVSIISTHDGVENVFNELCEDSRSGRKPDYSLHRTTLDEALADGLYKRICLVRGLEWSPEAEAEWRDKLFRQYGDDANEELLCIPKHSGGAYISRQLIEDRMFEAPVIRLELAEDFVRQAEGERQGFIESWLEESVKPLLEKLPRDRQHVFGWDFGRVSDLSIFAPMTLERTLLRRVPFLVELRNVPFAQQEQVLKYCVDALPSLLGGKMDAGGNGAQVAEFAALRYGLERIEQVKLSESWYAENLPRFKAAFEDALLAIPRDADILSDLRALQVIGGVPKLPKTRQQEQAGGGKKGKQRHGDAAVALALAHAASRLEIEVYDYHPVRPGRSDDDSRRSDSERLVKVTGGFRGIRGGLL